MVTLAFVELGLTLMSLWFVTLAGVMALIIGAVELFKRVMPKTAAASTSETQAEAPSGSEGEEKKESTEEELKRVVALAAIAAYEGEE